MEEQSSNIVCNSCITMGIGVIERALDNQLDTQIERLALVPPRSVQVQVRLTVSLLNQTVTVHPSATIELQVANGGIQLVVTAVNLLGVSVPRPLIDQMLQELIRPPQAEANDVVHMVVDKTGLSLRDVSVTEDSLVMDFAP
jgi:phage-related holin